MPFSKFLMLAPLSKKRIRGDKAIDTLEVTNLNDEEIILFFKIDETIVRQSIQLTGNNIKCCDGLILYAEKENAEKRVLCLVEMKSIDTPPAEARGILPSSRRPADTHC